MPRIILIRAAQTDWQAQGRLSGDISLPLNEIGHRQAVSDSQAVAQHHLTAIHSGLEQATRQTASIIAHELKLRVRTGKELHELDLGHWEGLTIDEFRERFAKANRQWRQDPTSVEPPEGEAVTVAAHRLAKAVAKIAKRHPDETVAIVLGQFAAAIVRCELDDKNYDRFWDYVDGDERLHAFDLPGPNSIAPESRAQK